MEFKTVLCFSALVIQTISAQCVGNLGFGPGVPEVGCGVRPAPCAGPLIASEPYIPAALANMPPPGMSIASDNLLIEGPVVVAGRMPFVGAASVEGVFPTAGGGVISYGCGDGAVGIVAEGPVADFAYNGVGPVGCGSRVLY